MRTILPCLLLATAGCVEPSATEPGQETGPCLDGSCFDGLVCLSDFCVGPDADPGETGGENPSGSQSAGPSGGPSSDEGESGGSEGDGDPSGNETGGDDGPPSDDTGVPGWGSCEQLDILFVVDNSASMFDEQGALTASAPAFFDDLRARSGSSDHHVMVVDTDPWLFGGCELECGLGLPSCSGWEGYVCGETQPLQCEDVLGAGVTHPRGANASNTDCELADDARWLSLAEPDAAERFVCAASVGTGSTVDPELPMEAMVTAINPVAGGAAAQCNAGFLRADAPLVVVFVTDEDDAAGDSSGTPEGWRQGLAAAKGGHADRIAVLGVFGDNDQPGAICDALVDSAGAEPSARLGEFVELFGDRGVRSSVCAAQYDHAFADLLDVLDAMCN
jgi:hypothetical protein